MGEKTTGSAPKILMGILIGFTMAWVIFLTVLFTLPEGGRSFYDYRADADVSDQYRLVYRWWIMLLDPILFPNKMFGVVVPLVIIIATALILHIILHVMDKFVYKNQFFKGEFVGRLAYNIDHALWFSFLVILTALLILNYQSERLGDYKFEHDYR